MIRSIPYIIFIFLLYPLTVSAGHRAKLTEGSLAVLRGTTVMNVQFSYEGLTIGGAGLPETEYKERRKIELNAKKPGRGDAWLKSWESLPGRISEPGLIDFFNKTEGRIQLVRSPEAAYTLLVKIYNIEPGFNAVVVTEKAFISAEVWVVDTKQPGHVICKIRLKSCPGELKNMDFDSGRRIGRAYEVAGYRLAMLFRKKLG